jgi:UDP-N-acetylmuramoyl-L-alanyl-D-glutamate--2,6-diaminopimelate ligase
MKLSELFSNLPQSNGVSIIISDLIIDSRKVTSGSLFLAYLGEQDDGRCYVQEAVQKGAAAIVYESSDGYQIPSLSIPAFPVPNLKSQLSDIAARFYDNPADRLHVIGVTGTNGKTSCVYFIAQILHRLGEKVGVLSTIGNGIYPTLVSSKNTTIGAVEMQKALAAFKRSGCQYVCMEVSSHSLLQHRVKAVYFNYAVFTHLSREHLDYHHTMEQYFQAKLKLFLEFDIKNALINADDVFGQRIIDILSSRGQPFTAYGIESTMPFNSFVSIDRIKRCGLGFKVAMRSTSCRQDNIHIAVMGRFNLYNILAAVGVLLVAGFSFQKILAQLSHVTMPVGRMEIVAQSNDQPLVIVDFAHTPDALKHVLEALRPFCKKNLWCVFGCGGNRDEGKRAMMAHIVQRYADCVVLTADNPRTEPIEKIIKQTCQGFKTLDNIHIDVDRISAIEYAIHSARSGDIILVAGKGHEDYQAINGVRHPYSDQAAVRQVIAQDLLRE